MKKRFNFLTVKMTRDGNVESVARRHTSLSNAAIYCAARNDGQCGDEEFAVVVRPSNRPKRGGALPKVRAVTPSSPVAR